MKRILLSLGIVTFIGAVAVGATGAFFSDSETSTANVFTAGAIDLKVDSTAHYNHMVCTLGGQEAPSSTWQPEVGFTPGQNQYPAQGSPCDGTWSLTDLGPTNHFFNFGDVKPGDNGEDTVSLHIDNNPAWACAYIKTTANDENTYTQPEINAGDLTQGPTGNGELAQNITVFAWLDKGNGDIGKGDNVWQAGEPVLYGPISLSGINSTTTLPLADPATNGGQPLAPTDTNYIGLAWCAGTMNTSVPGTITCNGATMDNKAQTDSAKADVTFHVEQSRNNSSFRCIVPTVIGANDLEPNTSHENLANALSSTKWFMYNDTTDAIDNTLGSFVVGPSTPPLGTKSVEFTLGANPLDRKDIATFQFQGTSLASIGALSFSSYSHSGVSGPTESPYLVFNVDFTGSSGVYQNRLVYVPSLNGAASQDTWNTNDAIQGGSAKWVYSGANWPAPNAQPGTTLKTWAQILTDYPSARLLPVGGLMGVRVGEPGPTGYIGDVDNFSITISGSTKTFDFGN